MTSEAPIPLSIVSQGQVFNSDLCFVGNQQKGILRAARSSESQIFHDFPRAQVIQPTIPGPLTTFATPSDAGPQTPVHVFEQFPSQDGVTKKTSKFKKLLTKSYQSLLVATPSNLKGLRKKIHEFSPNPSFKIKSG